MSRFLVVLLCSVCFAVGMEQETEGDEWSEVYHILDGQNIAGIDGGEGVHRYAANDDDLKVAFMLFNRNSLSSYTIISADDDHSLQNVDNSKDLKVIIHGWRNRNTSAICETLKKAYLTNTDVNVILVDWSSKSYDNYISSRMTVPKVGREVARLIDAIVRRGMRQDKIHLIGHSLGAHIAGIAGLRMETGPIARVTGLDPASPMFTATEDDILKPQSAEFVDVIHTCGYMLGFISPLGHADFYPNKGTPSQPGCGFDYNGKCSHSRSFQFFAESLSSNRLLAVKCRDTTEYDKSKCSSAAPIPMGEYTPTSARGIYVLKTNKEAPFGVGTPKL